MLGGRPDSFIVELGNPFKRNHFYKSWNSPRYNKLFIDWKIAVEEGRIKRDFIEEMREKSFFDVFYECKFPEPGMTDKEGYTPLIPEDLLERAKLEIPKRAWVGRRRLGVDIGHGRDSSVWVLRVGNYATILEKNQSGDLMNVAGITVNHARNWKIPNGNIFVDDVGVGAGVVDRLKEHHFYVNSVNTVEKPMDSKFKNRRAEQGWRLKEWLGKGGKLDPKCDWSGLLVMKYKLFVDKIKLISKEEIAHHGLDSPDVYDALALTFNLPVHGLLDPTYQEVKEKFNPYDII